MAESSIFSDVLTALGNAATTGAGIYSLFGPNPKTISTAGPPLAQTALEQQLLGGAAAGQQIGLNEAALGQFRRPYEDEYQARLREQLTNQISRRVGGGSYSAYGSNTGGGRAALINAIRAKQSGGTNTGASGSYAAPNGAGVTGAPQGGLNLAALLQLLGGGGAANPTNAQPGGATQTPGTVLGTPPAAASPATGLQLPGTLPSVPSGSGTQSNLPASAAGPVAAALAGGSDSGGPSALSLASLIGKTGIGLAKGVTPGGFDIGPALGALLGPLSSMLGAPQGYSAGLGALGAAAGGAGPLGIAASFAGPLLISALTGGMKATNDSAAVEYQRSTALRQKLADQLQAGEPISSDDLRYIGFFMPSSEHAGYTTSPAEELYYQVQQALKNGQPLEKIGDDYLFRNVQVQPVSVSYNPTGMKGEGRPTGNPFTLPQVRITQDELNGVLADLNYHEPREIPGFKND